MKRKVLQVNSNGVCLLCLRNDQTEDDNRWADEGDNFRRVSGFKMLLRYLNVNYISILNCTEAEDDRNIDLKVELCHGCASVVLEFWQLYQDQEKIRLRLENCMDLVKSVMKQAEHCPDRVREYQRWTTPNVSSVHQFAKRLRRETLRKCHRKSILPCVNLQRVVNPTIPTPTETCGFIPINHRKTSRPFNPEPTEFQAKSEIYLDDVSSADDDLNGIINIVDDDNLQQTEVLPHSHVSPPSPYNLEEEELVTASFSTPPSPSLVVTDIKIEFGIHQNSLLDHHEASIDSQQVVPVSDFDPIPDSPSLLISENPVIDGDDKLEIEKLTKIWTSRTSCLVCRRHLYKRNLNYHMKFHGLSKSSKFPCEFCPKKIVSEKNSHFHRNLRHTFLFTSSIQCLPEGTTEETLMDVINYIISESRSTNVTAAAPIGCPYCKSNCRYNPDIKMHLLTKHFDKLLEKIIEAQKSPTFARLLKPKSIFKKKKVKPPSIHVSCKVCKKLISIKCLSKHMQRHSGNIYNCQYCPYWKSNQTQVQIHVNSSHTYQILKKYLPPGTKSKEVESAIKIVLAEQEVTREKIENKIKENFKCSFCSNLFQSRGYLKFHLLDKHGKEVIMQGLKRSVKNESVKS